MLRYIELLAGALILVKRVNDCSHAVLLTLGEGL